MQNEVSWYFFIKKYQRDLVLLKENIIFFLRNWPTIRIIRKPKNIKNTGNYFISDGVGGGFLGEFSVAWIILFNAFIHHEFFFWSIFLQQICFFFLPPTWRNLPLFIIIPSSFDNVPISRKDFVWGWGLSAVNYRLLYENLMLC